MQLRQKEQARGVLERFLNRWKGDVSVREHAERLLMQLGID